MFRPEKIVGFEYSRNGKSWHLSNIICDPEVTDVIGFEVLYEPPLWGGLAFPPFHAHIKMVGLALAEHKLDGGAMIQDVSNNETYWKVLFKVEKRKERPGHHQEAAEGVEAG